MPQASQTIRAASLNGFTDLAAQLGLDATALLRAQGLSVRMLAHPETPVRLSAVRRLLEAGAQAAGVEDFGLRMAQRRRLSNLGPIAIVLRAAPTARDALDTLVRYLRLLNASLVTRIEDHDDLVVIREELLAEPGEPVRQSVELAVGVMVRIIAELLGQAWRPRAVCFAHRPPRQMELHRRLLGPAVRFDAPFNGVLCAAADLKQPLPDADSGMAEFARQYLDQALSRDRGSALDRARALIVALLPGGRCTAESVAAHLTIDRRTLHRHLAAEGTTFVALMAQVRGEFAERHLRHSDRPLAELGDLLGFASASAFAAWFRRQYACTASQWRAQGKTAR